MEEISLWLVYFVIMLPSIGDALLTIGLLSVMPYVFVMIVSEGKVKNSFKYGLSTFCILTIFAGVMIPSTKQMAAIVAGHWAINNEEVRQLPDQVGMILDSYISDMKEGNE